MAIIVWDLSTAMDLQLLSKSIFFISAPVSKFETRQDLSLLIDNIWLWSGVPFRPITISSIWELWVNSYFKLLLKSVHALTLLSSEQENIISFLMTTRITLPPPFPPCWYPYSERLSLLLQTEVPHHSFSMRPTLVKLFPTMNINIPNTTYTFVPDNQVVFIHIYCRWPRITTLESFDNVQIHVELDDVLVFRSSKHATSFEENQSPTVKNIDWLFNLFRFPKCDSTISWAGYEFIVIATNFTWCLWLETYIRLADDTEVPATSSSMAVPEVFERKLKTKLVDITVLTVSMITDSAFLVG